MAALQPDPDRIRRDFAVGEPPCGRLHALLFRHRDDRLGRLLVGVLLTATLTGLLPGVTLAAAESRPSQSSLVAREVRTFDAKDFGASRPTGLAYDSRRGELLVASPGPGGATVHILDRLWVQVAESSIAGIADPSTLRFDNARDVVTWAQNGRVFGVPGQSLRTIRSIDASTAAAVGEEIDLERAASQTLIASNESDGLVYVLDFYGESLETFDENGELVETFDLGGLNLRSPESMTFAPSTDTTDDPDTLNLFVADSGDATWDGGVTEITLEQPMILAAETVTASLVQVIETSAWNPPSTDPSGIVWNPSNDQLIVVDSEVNETDLFQGVNMWHINRVGMVLSTGATWGLQSAGSYSDEPTGLGYDSASNTLFVSDDTGTPAVYVVEPGPDGHFGTTDDMVSTISNFGASDTEDPEFDPVSGHLFILGGIDREVYRVNPVDGIFGNGNDITTSFDISHLGPTDFEGMTSSVSRQSLFIGARTAGKIFEVTHEGQLIRTIDVAGISGLNFISGLAMAPRSTDPSVMSLWIVDRGVDEVNDGRLFEIAVRDLVFGNSSCPAGAVPSAGFTDLSGVSPEARWAIDCVAFHGVSQGVGNDRFAPLDLVPRWQMALFLARALDAAGVSMPVGPEQGFVDLGGFPVEVVSAVNGLAVLGVAQGVGGDRFDPHAAVSRWQMALFLARGLEAAGVSVPAGSGQIFVDLVGFSDEVVGAVNGLAALEIAKGVGGDRFDPFGALSRWQMALFLARQLPVAGVEPFRVAPTVDSVLVDDMFIRSRP